MTTQKLLAGSIILCLVSIVILATTTATEAASSNCEVAIDANDAMAFSTKKIEVSKSCKEFTINLKHTGKLAKNSMGHNLVISKASDQQVVIDDGVKAGAASDYVKAKDERVVMATKIIGGGEAASAKFKVSKLNPAESYSFFCSFPGHAFMMKGTVNLI